MSEIVEFNELQASITGFLTPVFTIEVTDFPSAQAAIDVLKELKPYQHAVETKRKELIAPFRKRILEVDAYAKQVAGPLDLAEAFLKKHIALFEERQAEFRRAEQERLRAERAAAEQRLAEERHAAAQALLERQERERDAAKKTEELFGDRPETIADQIAREEEEHNAEMFHVEQEQAQELAQVRRAEWENAQKKIKGVRKNWKCELLDIEKVPAHFVIKTLNSAAVLAAARGGLTELPGVRLYQETSVAVGANTRVSKLALESGE